MNLHLKQLLLSARTILEHQKEKEQLKGESFNVFSILRMEHRENETHSAFICELLNPHGSHLKGDIFLELFLSTIGHNQIDAGTAHAGKEVSMGHIDDESRTGGRIDICINDNRGRYLYIENKIYAGDQPSQIERYCNYRKGRNTVYYLTLHGNEPNAESRGRMTAGKDFHLISYQQHIMAWLELCIKESADAPILRETIRQYLVLVRKLVNPAGDPATRELPRLILQHYEEAALVYHHFRQVGKQLAEEVRQDVIRELRQELPREFEIVPGSKAHEHKYSQIWVRFRGQQEEQRCFGIESFSGDAHYEGALFIGVYNPLWHLNKPRSGFKNYTGKAISKQWTNIRLIGGYEGYPANMSDSRLIRQLHNDHQFRSRFVHFMVSEVSEYIHLYGTELKYFLQREGFPPPGEA